MAINLTTPETIHYKGLAEELAEQEGFTDQDSDLDEAALQDAMQEKLHHLDKMVQQNNSQAQQTQSKKALAYRMKKAAGRNS
jgi:hypothetical protein